LCGDGDSWELQGEYDILILFTIRHQSLWAASYEYYCAAIVQNNKSIVSYCHVCQLCVCNKSSQTSKLNVFKAWFLSVGVCFHDNRTMVLLCAGAVAWNNQEDLEAKSLENIQVLSTPVVVWLTKLSWKVVLLLF
jgi:hypothetical protein